MELRSTSTPARPASRVEARPELDDLGIDGRPRVADGLDVELPELAVAPGLRPVVAEHRPDLVQPSPAAATSACRAGRRRARCPRSAPVGAPSAPPSSVARRDPEQLLLDDVGDLADAALEDGRLLEQRRLDGLVAVARGQVRAEPLEAVQSRALGRAAGHACRAGPRKVGIGPESSGRTSARRSLQRAIERAGSALGRPPG